MPFFDSETERKTVYPAVIFFFSFVNVKLQVNCFESEIKASYRIAGTEEVYETVNSYVLVKVQVNCSRDKDISAGSIWRDFTAQTILCTRVFVLNVKTQSRGLQENENKLIIYDIKCFFRVG